MPNTAELLAAYDAQLRLDAEVRSADRVRAIGPLRLAVFRGDQGFITSGRLSGFSAAELRALASEAVETLASDPDVGSIEWKTRAHDDAPGLLEALTDLGFVAGDAESVMIGEASALDVDAPLPDGVAVRRLVDDDEVRVASGVTDAIFGEPASAARAADLIARIADGAELWVAEADGVIVSTGRLEPVPGTAFAGLWGGATRSDWRHRGIYRALTARRARSALERGYRYLQSDSTEFSRPILERAGMVKVTETTPYEWRRA